MSAAHLAPSRDSIFVNARRKWPSGWGLKMGPNRLAGMQIGGDRARFAPLGFIAQEARKSSNPNERQKKEEGAVSAAVILAGSSGVSISMILISNTFAPPPAYKNTRSTLAPATGFWPSAKSRSNGASAAQASPGVVRPPPPPPMRLPDRRLGRAIDHQQNHLIRARGRPLELQERQAARNARRLVSTCPCDVV